MQYFIDNGIKPERLVARGFGESKPMAANSDENGADNPEGRAQNRRVELTIVEREAFEQIRADNAERRAAEKKAAQQAALAEQRRREREREQARQAEGQKNALKKPRKITRTCSIFWKRAVAPSAKPHQRPRKSMPATARKRIAPSNKPAAINAQTTTNTRVE